MDRRGKFRVSVAASALSFLSIIALFLIGFRVGFPSAQLFGTLIIALLFVWLGCVIAAIAYTEDGWTVRGSAFEWILAACLAPILTLFLWFFFKDRQEDAPKYIDPSDYDRTSRL